MHIWDRFLLGFLSWEQNGLQSDWSWMTTTCVKWDGRKPLFRYYLLCLFFPQSARLASVLLTSFKNILNYFIEPSSRWSVSAGNEWEKAGQCCDSAASSNQINPCCDVGGWGTSPKGQGGVLLGGRELGTKTEAEKRKKGTEIDKLQPLNDSWYTDDKPTQISV